MITPLGKIDDQKLESYMAKLIGRIFKIIPMNEENVSTLEFYVDSLVREIFGNSKLFHGEEMIALCGTLKGLNYDNHKLLKSDVFKAIHLIEKARVN